MRSDLRLKSCPWAKENPFEHMLVYGVPHPIRECPETINHPTSICSKGFSFAQGQLLSLKSERISGPRNAPPQTAGMAHSALVWLNFVRSVSIKEKKSSPRTTKKTIGRVFWLFSYSNPKTDTCGASIITCANVM